MGIVTFCHKQKPNEELEKVERQSELLGSGKCGKILGSVLIATFKISIPVKLRHIFSLFSRSSCAHFLHFSLVFKKFLLSFFN